MVSPTAGDVPGRDVAERHGRADGGPGPGIAAAHDRRRGVAHRVEALDHGVVGAQHAGVLVGAQAT